MKLSKNFWAELSSSASGQRAHLAQAINDYKLLQPQESKLRGRKILRVGASELYEFGQDEGVPILIVPSMINKAYIVDLPDQSFVQSLCAQGFKVYVIEWGDPQEFERVMDFNDFILRINQFVDYLLARHKPPPVLLGYCMGGIMATLYASKYPEKVKAITQLAAPWDFAAGGFLRVDPHKLIRCFESQQVVPKAFFQLGFYLTRFARVNRKYIEFAKKQLEVNSFVTIESWIDDGIDMPKPVFLQFINDIVYQNKLVLGNFSVGSTVYEINSCATPMLSIIATKDSLVPVASSIAIGYGVPKSDIAFIATGHVGLVTTSRDDVAETIKLWLLYKGVNKPLVI